MRPIDADTLKEKFLEMGCLDDKPCYGAEIIDRMTTIQAIPLSVVKEIRAEIAFAELPKGHGRLIDADSMWNAYHDLDYDFYEAFDLADTIIEADNAESEET